MAEIYTITGATGNTGKIIVHTLLDAGKEVRIISRDVDKVNEFTQKGAEAFIGEPDDLSTLKDAFMGATAVYAMIPPNFWAENFRAFQNNIAKAQVDAVKECGVKFVVTLSSVGAHLPAKGGVVQGLYDMEQYFNKIPNLNVLHLRPSYFMENTLSQIDTIKQMGIMGSPVKGDLKFPIVSTKDIAEKAAQKLLDLDFSGKSVEYVLGSRDVSYNEIAQVFGKAIGKPDLKYVEFPYEDAKKAMMEGWKITESAGNALTEFVQTMNNGHVLSDTKRDKNNTTPTTIEDFAQTFAFLYNR